jgi:hypothetical protein
MPRSGGGVYTVPSGTAAVTNTTISSSAYNTFLNDLATAITQSLATTGVSTMAANLLMGGYQIKNLALPSVTTDAISKIYADSMSQFGGMQNKFRNPCFDIWARGTATITVTTAGSYTADGWFIKPAGASCAVQAAAASVGNTAYDMVITGATSVTDIVLKHVIDSYTAAPLGSTQVTVQFAMKNNTPNPITPTLTVIRPTSTADNYGATTTELATVNLQTIGASGGTGTCSYTFPLSAFVNLGCQITIDFGNNFGSNANSIVLNEFDIRQTPGVTTGLNSTPPPTEQRGMATEHVLNSRFFDTSFQENTTPANALSGVNQAFWTYTTGAAFSPVQFFKTTMRVAPSLSLYVAAGTGTANGAWSIFNGATWQSLSTITATTITTAAFSMEWTVSGYVANEVYYGLGNWVASAEITPG